MSTDQQVTSRFDPDRIEVDMDRNKIAESFQSPLYMLNIKQEEIPALLPDAAQTYAEPSSCLVAKVEYEKLNFLLGVDEAVAEASEYGTISIDASDAISSAIDDMIPFESVIKYVSGATRHEKKVEAAFFRGQIRRAYLRGYINRNMCEIPVPALKPGSGTYTAQLEPQARLETGDIVVSPGPRTPETTPETTVTETTVYGVYADNDDRQIAVSGPRRLTPGNSAASGNDGLLGIRD